MKEKPEIFTIGHGTRPIRDFINLLNVYGIKKLVDVRTIPASRHNPQFNLRKLSQSLKRSKIAYLHMRGLGGLRRPLKESPNLAWRNANFRGYADYTLTGEFRENLERLIKIARAKKAVIMCAETLPWRCHRSLIADQMEERGWQVRHIISDRSAHIHRLTPWAKVSRGKITYPLEQLKKVEQKSVKKRWPPVKGQPVK